MPFLVDSVAIELNRHGLSIHLVIHPVLAVRRDEAGRLRRPRHRRAGARTGCARASCCSRSTGRATRRCCRSSRRTCAACWATCATRSQDWRRCGPGSSEVLDELQAGAALGAGRASEPRPRRSCAWIADDHFTLARLLQLPARGRRRTASQLRRVKGTGLGILRAKDDGGLSQSFAALPAEIRARAPRAASRC